MMHHLNYGVVITRQLRLVFITYGEAFDNEIIGLQKGDKKTFSVTYPDDFKTNDVAGKTVDFDVEFLKCVSVYCLNLRMTLLKKLIKIVKLSDEWKEKLQKELDSAI